MKYRCTTVVNIISLSPRRKLCLLTTCAPYRKSSFSLAYDCLKNSDRSSTITSKTISKESIAVSCGIEIRISLTWLPNLTCLLSQKRRYGWPLLPSTEVSIISLLSSLIWQNNNIPCKKSYCCFSLQSDSFWLKSFLPFNN